MIDVQVKKYLKRSSKLNPDRPVLHTIQHKDKQFICNGFSLCVFDEYVGELENLPTTNETESLNVISLFPKNITYSDLTAQDKTLIKNINKYSQYLIEFSNQIFNTQLLKEIIGIVGKKDLKIADLGNLKGVVLKSNKISSYILPYNASKELSETTKDFTRNWLKSFDKQ